MEKQLDDLLPLMGVEQDCILSKQGDITLVFEAYLPEIFTLADQEYEAFHQAWVKALKVLPPHTVFHKQDWFIQDHYQPDLSREDTSFLSRCSERFFNERPFLDHRCYVLLTKKPTGRPPATSLFSSLLRRSLVPQQVLSPRSCRTFWTRLASFSVSWKTAAWCGSRSCRKRIYSATSTGWVSSSSIATWQSGIMPA